MRMAAAIILEVEAGFCTLAIVTSHGTGGGFFARIAALSTPTR
jgi:hypothetical protein